MHRLGHLVDGKWEEHSHAPVFEIGERLVAGAPQGDPVIFQSLVDCLDPPYFLLYVLHTPRGEAAAGRYQSPGLSRAQLHEFLARFESFLRSDGRYDIWAHSPSENGTVVWERHNEIFAYGPLERFSNRLISLGFVSGRSAVPEPHEHYYREECDDLAKEILLAFEWAYSPLRPEDEQ